MKTILLALMVAAVGLAACETVQTAGPGKGRIVRMAPIPDEPSAPRQKQKPILAAATSSAPAVAAAATTPSEAEPAPAPADSPSTSPAAAPSESAPADAATATTPDIVADSSTVAATPTNEPAPETPGVLAFDPSALMKATVGGMPLWLVALIVVGLLGALVVGMRGARRARDPYSSAEPEAEAA